MKHLASQIALVTLVVLGLIGIMFPIVMAIDVLFDIVTAILRS